MKRLRTFLKKDRSRGQSLVEVALFFPILIVMLAGLAEVSNLLLAQNRVTTASRIGTGFGASNYDRENFSDVTAIDMGKVTLNTVTETMDLSADKWDIWSVRAKVNEVVTATTSLENFFEFFETYHAYGNFQVVASGEWTTTLEPNIKQEMMNDLKTWSGGASGLEVVSSVPFHNMGTILGLPIWQWAGVQRLNAMTVMRVNELEHLAGCPLLPIAVRLNQYSIYPWNWDRGEEPNLNRLGERNPNDPVDLFPIGSGPRGWQYPQHPEPVYRDLVATNINSVSSEPDPNYGYQFQTNTPGISLREAIRVVDGYAGNIYWAREQTADGNFGFLTWRGGGSSALNESLLIPGNFYQMYPGSDADMNTISDPMPDLNGDGQPDRTGDGDGDIEIGEWLDNETGNVASTEKILDGYIDAGTEIVVLVFDTTNAELLTEEQKARGENVLYRVYDFIMVRLLGYSFQGGEGNDSTPSPKWVMFEYLTSEVECGADEGPQPQDNP